MMTRKFTLAALLLSAGLGLCARAQAPAPNTSAAATRELWLADEGRYVRRWLLLGPMKHSQADEIAKLGESAALTEPANGIEQDFNSGEPVRWRRMATYGDILDGFSGMRDGEVGLALSDVEWPAAGEARLLLGGNVRGVWVNGKWAGGGENSSAFVIDGSEVRVQLAAGSNLILLRVERVDRPVLVTLRALSPGLVDTAPSSIAPYITMVSEGPNTLRVLPGARRDNSLPQVNYEVIAPGGRRIADAHTLRNLGVTFDASSWPDGPYEVRVTAPNGRGDDALFHLPWYKGDAAAAAQRVIAAAAAAPADGHLSMLADMLRDRAGGDWRALHSPLMEYEELLLERAGQPGGLRSSGFVRLAWIDAVDGSTQFCRAYLPAAYRGKEPLPALIFLHGYNPPNPPYVRWWSIADRHNGVADRNGIVVLEPMGRGNVDYRWMGERDVLRCLAEAQKRIGIDAERVYLSGESMGGNGTWLIASRNPQLFAAAAPVYGGWDYRINQNGYAYTHPQATRPMERFVQEAHASFAGAEGLRNVPLYVLHGDEDAAVPVEQSRHGVHLLQRWGYDVRYREIAGLGHEDLKARDEIAQWLLTHRRDSAPRDVRLRSYDLAGASAHWVQVLAWQSPFEMMEARARVIDRGLVRVDTKNVAALTLTPPVGYLDADKPLRVVWNGTAHEVSAGKDGAYLLAGQEIRAGDKRPALEGRLTYFFNTPFAIVIGTKSKNPAMAGGIAQKGAALADVWERWQHVKPRIFLDTQVTPDIERSYSLLLLGGPDANQVSARLGSKLPLKVSANSVSIDGRKFAVTDAVAQMLYPSPRNAERYLLLVAPTSAAGLRYWNPQQFWHALNGFPMNFWDWTLVDGRRVSQESGLFPDRGWVAAGIFDLHWRRDDRFTVLGDEQARAAAPLRQAPPPGFKLPPGELDALVGLYRINPGQIGSGGLINVERAGDGITASAPEGGRAWPLEAEAANDFAVAGLGTPVNFLRDGAGNVTGVVYGYNGQAVIATKLPPGSIPIS
jgi:poly(3-hydroxybutyrate) depolymerase